MHILNLLINRVKPEDNKPTPKTACGWKRPSSSKEYILHAKNGSFSRKLNMCFPRNLKKW